MKTGESRTTLKRVRNMNIELRRLTTGDLEFMHKLVSVPEVTRYLPGMITDRKALEEWIRDSGQYNLEYIISANGVDIGECSLDAGGETAEIGFMLLPEHWRKGYGTQTVSQLTELAKGMHINILTAMTGKKNAAAIGLLKKSGFIFQTIGWMLRLPEDDQEEVSSPGQDFVQFTKRIG